MSLGRFIVFMMELDPEVQPVILGTVQVPDCFTPTAAMQEDAAALGILVGTADGGDLPLVARLPFMQEQGQAILDVLRARRATLN